MKVKTPFRPCRLSYGMWGPFYDTADYATEESDGRVIDYFYMGKREPVPDLVYENGISFTQNAINYAWSSPKNRNKEDFEALIVGGIEMLAGIEYHYIRYMALRAREINAERVDPMHFLHETIAYLNRVGQIIKFCQSRRVRDICPEAKNYIDKLSKHKKLRDKHTAHRSYDEPRGESIYLRRDQALSFLSYTGLVYMVFDKYSFEQIIESVRDGDNYYEIKSKIASVCEMVIKFHEDDMNYVQFSLEREHGMIVKEYYNLIVKITGAIA